MQEEWNNFWSCPYKTLMDRSSSLKKQLLPFNRKQEDFKALTFSGFTCILHLFLLFLCLIKINLNKN